MSVMPQLETAVFLGSPHPELTAFRFIREEDSLDLRLEAIPFSFVGESNAWARYVRMGGT